MTPTATPSMPITGRICDKHPTEVNRIVQTPGAIPPKIKSSDATQASKVMYRTSHSLLYNGQEENGLVSF
ncbi:hypothetical protein Tco_0461237 [Tanacetum coccineum]